MKVADDADRASDMVKHEQVIDDHEAAVRKLQPRPLRHLHARLEVTNRLVCEIADRTAGEARQRKPRSLAALEVAEDVAKLSQWIAERANRHLAVLLDPRFAFVHGDVEQRPGSDEGIARQSLASLD